MILQVFFCISSIAVILGESPQSESYDERGYGEESFRRRIDEYSDPRDENSKFLNPESKEDSANNGGRRGPRRGVVDREVADQLEGNGWLDVIPGTPGKDYPNYEKIPETSFSCRGKTPGGYYADIETRCQVFHVCNVDGQKSSFVCPSGSIFNQKYFVCDWWYDFECDDATDLYSLNEKINRGGTGSGPSGPGRIEENYEHSSQDENIPEDLSGLQNDGNFVSADGFDLSLAGTGEGGPGYARNKNNRGYQSNVDKEDYREKENGGNQGQERREKNFHGKKTAGEILKLDSSRLSDNMGADKNRRRLDSRDESPRRFSPGSIGGGDKESEIPSDAGESGMKHYRKQNSANGNRGVNYQGSGNSNAPLKTDNFRTGNDGNYDPGERPNGFNDNNHNSRREYPSASAPDEQNNDNNNNNGNYARRSDGENFENAHGNHNRNGNRNSFGQRSWKNSTARNRDYDNRTPETTEDNHDQGSSSTQRLSSGLNNGEHTNFDKAKEEKEAEQRENQGAGEAAGNNQRFDSDRNSAAFYSSPVLNNDEYRIPFGNRGADVRGRQRTSGGLPRGLGNGNWSSGRARELPGSDVIAAGGGITPPPAGGETVYDKGDQGSLNPEQKTFYSGRRRSSEVDPDDEKIGSDHQSQRLQRSDFRDDNSPRGIENNNAYDRRHPTPNPNSSTRNEKASASNDRGGNSRDSSNRRRQNLGAKVGNDYLIGIVPGADQDRADGSSDNTNQQRRFLPIL